MGDDSKAQSRPPVPPGKSPSQGLLTLVPDLVLLKNLGIIIISSFSFTSCTQWARPPTVHFLPSHHLPPVPGLPAGPQQPPSWSSSFYPLSIHFIKTRFLRENQIKILQWILLPLDKIQTLFKASQSYIMGDFPTSSTAPMTTFPFT